MYGVDHGLVTLEPAGVAVLRGLEQGILGWAAQCGAREYAYPPLMPVEALSRVDYFRNFPHLAVIASGIREDVLAGEYAGAEEIHCVDPSHLKAGHYAIPSAACYNVYFNLEHRTLPAPLHVTTVARCCRNEVEYVGLKRLWAFQMREIVCVGPREAVLAHLKRFRRTLDDFTRALGLDLSIETATDPFYDRDSSRAKMQVLFPVKEEFVYRGGVAISSVNFHRNFFGERCDIRDDTGEFCFSGCVAFGLERWLHALIDHFGPDGERITAALRSAFDAVPVAAS